MLDLWAVQPPLCVSGSHIVAQVPGFQWCTSQSQHSAPGCNAEGEELLGAGIPLVHVPEQAQCPGPQSRKHRCSSEDVIATEACLLSLSVFKLEKCAETASRIWALQHLTPVGCRKESSSSNSLQKE